MIIKEEVDYFASILEEEFPNVPKAAVSARAATLVEEQTQKVMAFVANKDGVGCALITTEVGSTSMTFAFEWDGGDYLVPCTLITTQVGSTSMTFALEWDGRDLQVREVDRLLPAKL